MRESLYSEVISRPSLPVANRAVAGTVVGAAVDLNTGRQQFRGAMLLVVAGTVGDGTHTVALEDSDDGVAWAAVPAEFRQGALPAVGAVDDDRVWDVGYLGNRRFLRAVVTVAGLPATGALGGAVGALVLLGYPSQQPAIH